MERRIMGNTGMKVSILGFGGAEIGFEGASLEDVEALLHEALDLGLNVIDTAGCYANSEELLGRAVGSRRRDFYLFTKCGHGDDYTMPAWTGPEIAASIERSLKRLKTDYIDLIQLHTCSKKILEQGEAIEVLKKAKEAGKTRFIGYSGDGEDALYAIRTGEFDVLQTSINIADQECVELTLPEAVERGMGVIAKRPLANVAWQHKDSPGSLYQEPYWKRLQTLRYNFLEGPVAEGVAMALKFTLSVPGVHTAIVGTKKPGRWRENADMLNTGLISTDQYERIRNVWNKYAANKEWLGQS